MARTNASYKRQPQYLKDLTAGAARKGRVVFSCKLCWKCWNCGHHTITMMAHHVSYNNAAGNPESHMMKLPHCRCCGKVAQRSNGSYFDMVHRNPDCKHSINYRGSDIPDYERLKRILMGAIECYMEHLGEEGYLLAKVTKKQDNSDDAADKE